MKPEDILQLFTGKAADFIGNPARLDDLLRQLHAQIPARRDLRDRSVLLKISSDLSNKVTGNLFFSLDHSAHRLSSAGNT